MSLCFLQRPLLFVDGISLFSHAPTSALFHLRYFLTLGESECRRRRSLRTDYDPADVPGYFDRVVWPAYRDEHLPAARRDASVTMLRGEDTTLKAAKVVAQDILDREWS